MEKIDKPKTKRNVPGLSSMSNYNDTTTDITKIGSRKRVEKGDTSPSTPEVSTPKIAASPTSPSATEPTVKAAPKPLVREVSKSKLAPLQYTSSSFKVGDKNYYVINDSSDVRNMIKWDSEGKVAADSPVQIIGKNVNGGFVLAADESTSGITKSKFPYSQDQGISFSSLESDAPDSKSRMQNIHQGSFPDLSEVADSKAAAELRGIYKRTGQL